MNFRPELAEKVMAGDKTVTRRLMSDNERSPWWVGACSLKPGRDYAVCPGRGKDAIGRARVVGVTAERLGYLTDDEACREGFADSTAFLVAWTTINGHYDPGAWVYRVELEAIR